MVLYNRLREPRARTMTPRTFLCAGKAGAYHLAKVVIPERGVLVRRPGHRASIRIGS